MNYLPSKKLLLIIILIIVVLGIWYAIFHGVDLNRGPVVFDRGAGITSGGGEYAKDTDGDGLRDWEEALWKTDPENPDTDGDGTSDGEEIRLGRNPVIAGPNDKLESLLTAPNQDEATESGKPETFTGALTQELFLQYLKTKGESGGYVDDVAKGELLQSVLDKVNASQEPIKHTVDDIKTTLDESVVRYKDYGNKLTDAIISHTSQQKENELVIMGQAIDKKDEKLLDKLPPIELMYRDLIKTLLLIETPANLSKFHIGVINSYEGILTATQSMKHALQDPLNGVSGVTLYVNNFKTLQLNIAQISDYFFNNKIYFEKNEKGFMLFPSKI